MKTLFDRFDMDKDGRIDREEFTNVLKDLRLPSSKSYCDVLFDELDVDGDGFIDRREFSVWVKKREDDMRGIFDQIDTDKDGLLNRDEVYWALNDSGMKVDYDVVEALIDLIDFDKDGLVSYDEFRYYLVLIPKLEVSYIFDQWTQSMDMDDPYTLPEKEKNVALSPLKVLFAGAIAGAISRTATAPLDRIKVMFQAGSQYNSIVEAVKGIFKEGGWKAFFKGNGTNIIKIAPETAMKFLAYENIKKMIVGEKGSLTILDRFLTGAAAGVFGQSVIYPLEIIKTRMALSSGEYKGIADCARQIVEKEGFRAIYKGLTPALTGIVPYAGVDLGMYSFLKDKYAEIYPDDQPSTLVLLSTGALSSACGQLASYPLVLVRTKMQAQGMKGRPVLYSGMVDCFKKVFAESGFKGLYRGIGPNFMKAIPAISISYTAYEKVKTIIQ